MYNMIGASEEPRLGVIATKVDYACNYVNIGPETPDDVFRTTAFRKHINILRLYRPQVISFGMFPKLIRHLTNKLTEDI